MSVPVYGCVYKAEGRVQMDRDGKRERDGKNKRERERKVPTPVVQFP